MKDCTSYPLVFLWSHFSLVPGQCSWGVKADLWSNCGVRTRCRNHLTTFFPKHHDLTCLLAWVVNGSPLRWPLRSSFPKALAQRQSVFLGSDSRSKTWWLHNLGQVAQMLKAQGIHIKWLVTWGSWEDLVTQRQCFIWPGMCQLSTAWLLSASVS